jgi:uncharacterized OB-fold protein
MSGSAAPPSSPMPLLPPMSQDAEPFWAGTRAGELRVPRCPETGRLFFPPRPRSPFAPRRAPEWATVSGRGTIWSFVVPHPPLLPPFSELAPYNVIAVALDEEPIVRLVGNLVAREGGSIAEIDPATIRIGAPVRVVFERVSEAVVLPRWLLAEPA